jgi:hypothetical protein
MQEIHGKKSLSVQLLKIMLRLRTLIIISDKDLIGVDSHPFVPLFTPPLTGVADSPPQVSQPIKKLYLINKSTT